MRKVQKSGKNFKKVQKTIKNSQKQPFFDEKWGKIAVFDEKSLVFTYFLMMSQKIGNLGVLIWGCFAFCWNRGRVKSSPAASWRNKKTAYLCAAAVLTTLLIELD